MYIDCLQFLRTCLSHSLELVPLLHITTDIAFVNVKDLLNKSVSLSIYISIAKGVFPCFQFRLKSRLDDVVFKVLKYPGTNG